MTMTDPQWWIDYMEGETDVRVQADLNELLSLSKADRTELEKLQKLRALIRQSEPHLILSHRQAGRLHDRIMQAVGAAAAENVASAKTAKLKATAAPAVQHELEPKSRPSKTP